MRIRTRQEDQSSIHVGLVVEGEVVSGLYLRRREMRIGAARVTMGGIGGVATKEERRMRGYSRRVMEYTVQYAADNGYDVLLLFGIRDFYPKWGFATSLGTHKMTIATKAARRARSHFRVRPFRQGDMPAILSIYNENNAVRTCSIVRPPFPEDRFPKGTRFFCDVHLFVVIDGDDQVIAYAGVDEAMRDRNTGELTKIEGETTVCEIGAKRHDAFPAILAELARLAEREKADEINVFLPPDHPFAIYCRSYGCSVHSSFSDDGGAMMRITNLGELFRKVQPELERRASRCGEGHAIGSLLIQTDIGDVTIKIGDGVEIAPHLEAHDCRLRLPQWALLQLLIGYRSIEDLTSDDRVEMQGEVIPLARVIFPPHQAYVWRADWF